LDKSREWKRRAWVVEAVTDACCQCGEAGDGEPRGCEECRAPRYASRLGFWFDIEQGSGAAPGGTGAGPPPDLVLCFGCLESAEVGTFVGPDGPHARLRRIDNGRR